MKKLLLSMAAGAVLPLLATAAETVASPDGGLIVSFDIERGQPVYEVTYRGKQVVAKSHLGLQLDSESARHEFYGGSEQQVNNLSLTDGFTLTKAERNTFDETWPPVWGEESKIRNHYN